MLLVDILIQERRFFASCLLSYTSSPFCKVSILTMEKECKFIHFRVDHFSEGSKSTNLVRFHYHMTMKKKGPQLMRQYAISSGLQLTRQHFVRGCAATRSIRSQVSSYLKGNIHKYKVFLMFKIFKNWTFCASFIKFHQKMRKLLEFLVFVIVNMGAAILNI